jgi:hypothetical protein
MDEFFLKGDPKVVSEGLSLSALFDLWDFQRGKGKIYKFLRGVLCWHFEIFFLRGYNFTNLHPKGGEWV